MTGRRDCQKAFGREELQEVGEMANLVHITRPVDPYSMGFRNEFQLTKRRIDEAPACGCFAS